MKISMKRIGALVLALVMVFGLLPVINNTAEALDVSGTWNDSTIGLSYEKGVNPNTAITPWTASGNTLTGACAGKTLGANYLASSNTLTITNLKSSTAKLSFDFELTGVFGSVTIDGTTYTEATSGSFSKELAANESIQIQLSAKKQLKSAGINTIGISITNLLLTVVGSGPVTTTFEAPAFGSYSVAYGDTTLDVAAGTASQSATNLPDVTYTLTANPGTGYKFVGWLDVTANKYLGIDATYVGGFESASTVKAIIVPESDPVFKTGDQYYSDLNEAVAYAQENALNQITLVQDGTLSAGSYTIPAGITLLIPKDTEYTVTGTDEMGIAPEYTTDVETPYAYRVLTMAEGAELIVNGVLDIEAKHTTYQGSPATRPYGGRVCGPYGAIYMSPNSSITVNNDAKLYAWGYVYGDGNVTANSGAEVYEIMQVTDFPGGGNMAGFVDNDPTYDFDGDGNPTNDYIKTFPFSQYYVQNIEVALTLHAGAAEYVYVSMTASSVSMGLPVQFIGESGMFNPADGTIVKDYDPSTDRLNVYVNGDATMAGITIDLTGTKFENTVKDVIGSSKVDSTTFILTLNSNISININSGITTVEQDLHLLPGVEISIAKDATLVIAQHNFAANTYDNVSVYGSGGYNVYVWDLENWGNYVFQNKKLVALNYSPTAGRIVRSTSDLKDVVIDVNGKVICEGYIYSTVTVDDEYTPVSGGGAIISSGKTGVIVMQNGCGVEDDAFCLNGSSNEDSSTAVDPAWLQNGDGSYLKTWCGECYFDVCPTCWGDRATMLDCEDCGGTGMADKICSHVGQIFSYCENHDCWYTEGHKDSTVEVTWIINGNGGPEEYTICSIPSYKGSTPTKPANGCTSYTFAGWAATADGEVLTQLPIVEADVAYFAIFTESVVHTGDNNQDHKCDGCGNPESTCVDADNDHYCDYAGCQNELSVCTDENYDHICDYSNCGEEVSSCEDNDENHYCDYSGCGAELSSCEDANADHYCDYVGCKELISDCEDTNNDHYCDHEGCKAQLSACEDANADHYCDYSGCQAEVSVCKDSNFDHLCDYAGCQATLSSCEDVNADHYCDYEGCQAQTSDCEDADADHYCDYVGCGEELSTCIDGDDKDHNCDYVGCQAENVDGGHHGGVAYCNARKICAECGESYGALAADNHAYSDRTYYGDITATTHTIYYSCCDNAKVTEGHTYVNGICGCNAVLSFTVTWIVDGETTTETYLYGATPTFTGSTDKASDGCTVYTFTGWDKEIATVTGDVTYTATYTESIVHVGDNDYDHFCDICGEQTSSCEDVNEDHFCDYSGCQATMSSCEDLDKDHNCDYSGCQATLSSCEDVNEDHYCDYSGCQANLSSCEDVNEDHFCDYAGCGEQTSSCEDLDEDHYCDYSACGGKLSNCVDTEGDGDHECDYTGCDEILNNCYGGEADCLNQAKCEECTQPYGALKDHGFAGWEYVDNGDNHTVWCDFCWDYSYTEGHKFVNADHTCDCGAVEAFTVTFMDGNTVFAQIDVPYNGALNIYGMPIPEAPAAGYVWNGWYDAEGNKLVVGMNVTSNLTFYADWKLDSYTVTWIVDGVTTTETYEYGATPSFKGSTDKASDGCTTYTFTGWDKEIATVTGDVTYTAQYTTGISHTGELEYTHVDEWTHKVTYSCCGAVVSEEAEHEDWDEDGYCLCGSVLININVWDAKIYGEEVEDTWLYIFVEPGTTYTLDVAPAEGWEKVCVEFLDYSTYTLDATLNATQLVLGPEYTSAYNENLEIYIYSYWGIVIDMNGGDVVDEYKETSPGYDPENGIVVIPMGSGDYTSFNMVKDSFAREGYTLIGMTDGQTTYTGGEEIAPNGEDLHLTLVWKADHVCSENLTEVEAVEPGCDTNGVKAYWACSCCKSYEDADAESEIADLTAWKNGDGKIEKLGHGHTEGLGYTDLENGNHSVTCKDCGTVTIESEGHDYTYNTRYHKCQCGAIEEFKLTVVYGINGEYTYEAMVPYWTRMDSLDVINNIPWRIYANDATHFGYFYLDDYYWDMDHDGDLERDRYFAESAMPGYDLYVEARYDFNGFVHDGTGWKYRNYGSFYKNMMVTMSMADVYENGSNEELEGIYMVDANGYRIENGMGRWYYLGYNPFSGITYEANAEDIAYYENKGQTFIDKEMTWYYFGADGKMAENYTGLVGDSYVINGQAAWHVGLVEIDGEYYYFKGDEVNGGNIMVTGDYYVSRNNTDFNMVVGGIYTFDENGVMQLFHGITESELFEGKRHYIGGRLTPGLGLVDLIPGATGEVRYFYVDSYGQLILDAEYYIGANSFGLAKGIYYFDAEGFLVIPEPEVGKNGLFFEEGKWYYYVDGAKAYCAGLIEIDGNWVYVRSDGSLATGVYYVTNTNDHATIASGTKCTFDENGVLIDPAIGMKVLDEGNCTIEDFDWDSSYVFTFTPDQDGKLTIEVSNIVLDGEYEKVGFLVDVYAENYGWLGENFVLDGDVEYYVSSNMGQCWVYIYPAYEADDYCNTASGSFDYKISFGNDGSPKNGIIDGYYYVDGHIAYAAGLIEIDGIYYYVRSNGQIVTDCQYWITNVNDTGYEPGLYEFDVDGWMSEIYVETFTGIRDGYFYMDDEIAYNAGLMSYNGAYVYVRSNGQVATGKYWITNHNDLLPEGFYDFGENGFYYPPVPENAYLVKDVVKNTETDGFFGYLGTAEGIVPQADGMLYIEVTDITYAEEILNAAGFDVYVDSSDYWAREFGPSVVGTATIMMPVTAGEFYALFVNPADIDGEGYSVINGTITYKIWSTVECDLEEVSIGE